MTAIRVRAETKYPLVARCWAFARRDLVVLAPAAPVATRWDSCVSSSRSLRSVGIVLRIVGSTSRGSAGHARVRLLGGIQMIAIGIIGE